jgi:hypothetical protein
MEAYMRVESSGWASIDSAPRDGTRLILWATYSPVGKPFAVMGFFDDSGLGWVAESLVSQELVQLLPSHWLPLPTPPK